MNLVLKGEGRAAFGVSELVLGQRLPDLRLVFRDAGGHALTVLPDDLEPVSLQLRTDDARGASQSDIGLVITCDQVQFFSGFNAKALMHVANNSTNPEENSNACLYKLA